MRSTLSPQLRGRCRSFSKTFDLFCDNFGSIQSFRLLQFFSFALGISATVAVFSVIYSVLLHPTPYPSADRVVRFVNINDKGETEYVPAIYREQIRQMRETRSIEEVVEMDERYLSDTTVDVPQDVDVVFLSGNAFPFF